MIGLSLSPKARRRKLKKDMLRQAVAENIRSMGGPTATNASRSRWPSRLTLLAAGVAAAAILGTLSLTLAGRGGSGSSDRNTADVGSSAQARPQEPVPAQQHLERPRALKPVLFGLDVKRVVIDPGHGGTDPGAVSENGLWEKDLTLDLARRLRVFLIADGFEVVLTREDDRTMSLRERVTAANSVGGDLFLSIHVNSIPVERRRGVETYYLGSTSDPAVETLALAENSESGYSLTDFRRLLEGVWADVRQEESRRFAELLQGLLVASLSRSNPAIEDRGIKRAPFLVLVGTDMPAALVEVSCISNGAEAQLLGRPEYREEIARGLATGIRTYTIDRHPKATAVQEAAAQDYREGEVRP